MSTPDLAAQPAPAGVYARGTTEFDRALGFFDAIFGFSATLLVANLDVPVGADWDNIVTLLGGNVGDQLLSFIISFVVIASFWRANHAAMSEFEAIDSKIITVGIMLVGLVIFIPFTTQGIGDERSSELPLPVALYAVNVALIVLASLLLETLGRRRGLSAFTRSRSSLLGPFAVVGVFLASIAVAYLVSADAAKLSWLSLILIGPLVGRLHQPAITPPPTGRIDNT